MARGDEPPEMPDASLIEPQPPGTVEAEQLSEKDLRDASPLIDAFDLLLANKIYSKHWSLREEALVDIRKAMSKLEPTSNKDEALLFLRGALVAINRIVKDNVFAVFTLALDLHNMILSEFITRHRIARSETANFLEKTIPNLLMKAGDSSTRHREAAKALIIEESHLPEVKATNMLMHECLRPFRANIAPRLALSRTEIVDMLYVKHGLHDSGMTLNSLLTFLTVGALRHTAGEVRDKAEHLLVTLYEHVGTPVKDYLLNFDEKTRKSLLYKQLFKAFDRIDKKRRGTVDEDDDDEAGVGISHYDAVRRVSNAKEVKHEDLSSRNQPPGDHVKQANVAHRHQQQQHQQQQQQQQQPQQQRRATKDTSNKKTSSRSSPVNQPKNQPDKNGNNGDSERVCIFCGEANDAFTEDGLDVHYWKACPLLMRCIHCHQVVEISALTEHLLEECDSNADFVKCARCSEAISTKVYAKHSQDHRCRPAEPGKNRCQLCHANIPSSEESWRAHLMLSDGCPQNPRRRQLPKTDQPSTVKPNKSSPSRNSPSNADAKRSPMSAKVKVK